MKLKKILVALLSMICIFVACGKDEETTNNTTNTNGTETGDDSGNGDGTETTESLFSVSSSTQVIFSSGNLQYQASTNTWRFAENQWDTIGAGNKNISSSYTGWIDLFGWGTSGYNDKYPYTTSSSQYDYPSEIVNSNYDWGAYNAIQDANTTHPAGTWRTLTSAEWGYLFNTRTASTINGTANARYAEVKVNGICGIMLFPDVFTWPNDAGTAPTIFNTYESNWNSVDYTTAQFAILENSGVAFLPASGYRRTTVVDEVGTNGSYWSTTPDVSDDCAYYLNLCSNAVYPQGIGFRYYGRAVRLVKNKN